MILNSAKYFLIPILSGLLLFGCGTQKKSAANYEADGNTTEPKSKNKTGGELPERQRLEFDHYFFEGNKQKILGNGENAIGYFKKALEVNPKSHTCMYLMGEIYFSQKNYSQAGYWLQKATEIESSNPYYFHLLGETQASAAQHEAAAETFKKLYKLKPKDADVYFEVANQQIYAKKYDDAIATYELMEKKFGIAEEIILQKQRLFIYMRKPDKAIAELKRLSEAFPNEVRYMVMLAQLYGENGQNKEAVDIYNKVLAIEPDNGYARFGVSEYYRLKGDKEKWLAELKLAFADKRLDTEAKFNMIFSLIPAAGTDSVLKANIYELAQILSETHPEEPNSYALLADLHYTDKEFEKARENYLKALDLNPANLNAWRQLCVLDDELNDFKAVAAHSEKAIEYFPNQVVFYYFAASAHQRLKQYEKAVQWAEMGVAIGSIEDEINILLYTTIGDVNHELKKHPASDKAYEKALELDSENPYVLNNYAYYLSLRKENLAKAEQMSKKSLELEPGNASYLDTYGWILYQQGNYSEAKTYIEKALEKSAGSAEVLEHMGDILYRLGQKEKATEYWKLAADKGTASEDLKKKIAGAEPF